MSEIAVPAKLDTGIMVEVPKVGFVMVALPMFPSVILIMPLSETTLVV